MVASHPLRDQPRIISDPPQASCTMSYPPSDTRPVQTLLCWGGWPCLWLAEVFNSDGICFSASLTLLAVKPKRLHWVSCYVPPEQALCSGLLLVTIRLITVPLAAACRALLAASEGVGCSLGCQNKSLSKVGQQMVPRLKKQL